MEKGKCYYVSEREILLKGLKILGVCIVKEKTLKYKVCKINNTICDGEYDKLSKYGDPDNSKCCELAKAIELHIRSMYPETLTILDANQNHKINWK